MEVDAGRVGWWLVARSLMQPSAERLRGEANTIGGSLEGITILISRMHGRVTEYAYGPGIQVERLGRLTGFRIRECEPPMLPRDARQAHAILPWSKRNQALDAASRQDDAAGIRQSVESALTDDEWLAFSFRQPSSLMERARIRRWVDAQHGHDGTDPLLGAGGLVCRVSAGAPGDVKSLAIAGARAVGVNPLYQAHVSRPGWGAVSMALIVCVLLGAWDRLAESGLPLPAVAWWAWILCLLALLAAGLRVFRWIGPYEGMLARPRHRYRPYPHARSTGDEGKPARELPYPTARSSILVTPLSAAGLLTPLPGDSAAQQAYHPMPSALAERMDLRLGVDQAGNPAGIDSRLLYSGISVFGQAGTGKTVLTHGIVEWLMKHRMDSDPKTWGRDSRIIDFEMKDSTGLTVYDAYKRKNGLRGASRLVDLPNPRSAQIDLIGYWSGNDALSVGVTAASMMRASFEDGDIRGQSFDSLKQAFVIGVACQRYEEHNPGVLLRLIQAARRFPGSELTVQPATVLEWAYLALLGGRGGVSSSRALGLALRTIIMNVRRDTANRLQQDMVEAADAALALYGGSGAKNDTPKRADRDIQQLAQAPRNKLNQLLDVGWLFDTRRARATWSMVLDQPADYMIIAAPHDGLKLPDGIDRVIGSWLLQSLYQTINSRCDGWQAKGKHTAIVCDEVSLLAAGSPRSLVSLREQGRGFGVIPVFATQYPDQLPDVFRQSMLGYGTLCAYSTRDKTTARLLADKLSDTDDGSDGWTSGVVVNLPQYTMAVRTGTVEQLQPAFIIRTDNFDLIG